MTLEEFGSIAKLKDPSLNGVPDGGAAVLYLKTHPWERSGVEIPADVMQALNYKPPKEVKPGQPAPGPMDGGFMGGVSNFLFERAGSFFGNAVGQVGEGLAILTDKTAREQALTLPPDAFKQVFPFLGKHVDEKAPSVALKTAGEGLGAAGELAPFATGLPGGATRMQRVARGATFGAAGGLASGLASGDSAKETAGKTITGGIAGAVVSSAVELLAAAGDKAAKALMDSALNPYKKQIMKVERLVDDKTLSERLLQDGIKAGTNEQILAQLKAKETSTAQELDKLLDNHARITPWEVKQRVLQDLMNDKSLNVGRATFGEMTELLDKEAQRLEGAPFTLAEALKEKRDVGHQIGSTAWNRIMSPSPEAAQKVDYSKIVKRKLYDAWKTLIEERSDNPEMVRELNQKLSTYIDAQNLFQAAKTRGVKLITVLMGGLGALGAGVLTTLAQPDSEKDLGEAGVAAGKAGLVLGAGTAAVRSTLLKTLLAEGLHKGSGALSSDAMNRIVDRMIFGLTDQQEKK